MKLIAPAKINLALHILGRRADGYHELSSFVCFSKFGDNIEIIENNVDSIEINGLYENNVSKDNNSAQKALNWFKKRENISANYRITITKNIPVEAGLGGGTADCATILRALYDIHKHPYPSFNDLLELGADVPVSFYNATAIMEGIGEKIYPTKLDRPYGMVLINPNLQIPTGQIFSMMQSFDQPIKHKPIFTLADIQNLSNNMTPAAEKLHPEIGKIIHKTEELDPLLVRMTGSGATIFALTPLGEEEQFAQKIAEKFPDYWIMPTQTSRSTT